MILPETDLLAAVTAPGWLASLRAATRQDGDCWIWQRAVNSSGYGVMRIKGMPSSTPAQMTHRVAWMARAGRPVPAEHDIDHICNVPLCCNPAHLQPVVHEENVRLAVERRAAKRPPPPPKRPSGSIRVRLSTSGAPRYVVLFRDYTSGTRIQSSRTFGTREEAELFHRSLPPRPYRKAA